MVVPVVLGMSSFDYRPLRFEQSRLSKTLVLPSPRDKDDTALSLEVEDDQDVPFKYPTFIKVRYDKEGDLPLFELWMKDNFDQEYKISKEHRKIRPDGSREAAPTNVGTSTIGINDDPLVAPAPPNPAAFLSRVNNSFAVNPITGEIYRNAYWDEETQQIRDADGDSVAGVRLSDGSTGNTFNGTLVGTIKYDAVTGLALAAVNTRISDISNAVEGVTKVLQVASQQIQNVLDIIR